MVQKWEAGTKKPSGMALKLLDIVHKHGLAVLAYGLLVFNRSISVIGCNGDD
ncbi:hypothetical protein MCEGE14_01632 [Burkholderiaceae bacterium]